MRNSRSERKEKKSSSANPERITQGGRSCRDELEIINKGTF
jgi:hypothetical protein